jgi:hypothetical protein
MRVTPYSMHAIPGTTDNGVRLIQEVQMRGHKPHSPKLFSASAIRSLLLSFGRSVPVLVLAAAIACVAQDNHPAANQQDKPAPVPQAAASAASSSQTTSPALQTGQPKAAAADSERKKQIADESTQLLSMALALKAEVDKTTKDTLSINVIRKADEIEKLARTVKEKMKQSSGAS